MNPSPATEKAESPVAHADLAKAAGHNADTLPNKFQPASPIVEEGTIIDPVFGEIREDGPSYRSVRALSMDVVLVYASTGNARICLVAAWPAQEYE